MATPEVSVLQRSDLNDFLFAAIGTEASGMTLSVLSALARQGSDPWREASRLAHLSKAEASDSLAHTIADMPRSLWDLPDATAIAARLIGLLPARPSRAARAARDDNRARDGSRTLPLTLRALPSARTIAMLVCLGLGLGYFVWVAMRPAPSSYDGSDVGTFTTQPMSPATGSAADSQTVPTRDLSAGRVTDQPSH